LFYFSFPPVDTLFGDDGAAAADNKQRCHVGRPGIRVNRRKYVGKEDSRTMMSVEQYIRPTTLRKYNSGRYMSHDWCGRFPVNATK